MFRLPIVKFFNRIFNRVTITVVLVALQVLWLLWAFWSFTAGRVWLNGALKALSILIVLYLVRKDENSAYKIGWIVLIGLLPLLGGALYLAFGNKAPAKHLRERMQKVEQAHQTELAQPEGQTDALDISSRNLSRYVAKFGPYPAWRDTAAHYFSCGEEMYPQLLADLDKAEKFIFLEFFILRSGKMWDGVEQILRRKAAQGVDVRLIYDDFGSLLGLPSDFVIRMERAHIRCIPFNPVVPLVSLVMNHRDHRKIVVVDGNVAYTGGVNLADEYINAEQRFGYWKDAAIRLEGAAVWNFTVMFLNVWNAFRPQETDYTAFAPTRLPAVQDGVVQPYADSPLDEEPLAETVYLDILSQAQRYVYIYTPYLAVGEEMLDALKSAAKRGVDVRLILPGIPISSGCSGSAVPTICPCSGRACAFMNSRPVSSTPSAMSAMTAWPWWAASIWITGACFSILSAEHCSSITARSPLCGRMWSAPCRSAGRSCGPTAAPICRAQHWTACCGC